MSNSPDSEPRFFALPRSGKDAPPVLLGMVPADPCEAARAESEHRAAHRTDEQPLWEPELLIVPGRDE